jgi:hypothetical protein
MLLIWWFSLKTINEDVSRSSHAEFIGWSWQFWLESSNTWKRVPCSVKTHVISPLLAFYYIPHFRLISISLLSPLKEAGLYSWSQELVIGWLRLGVSDTRDKTQRGIPPFVAIGLACAIPCPSLKEMLVFLTWTNHIPYRNLNILHKVCIVEPLSQKI